MKQKHDLHSFAGAWREKKNDFRTSSVEVSHKLVLEHIGMS